jgi:hypothetical protein
MLVAGNRRRLDDPIKFARGAASLDALAHWPDAFRGSLS